MNGRDSANYDSVPPPGGRGHPSTKWMTRGRADEGNAMNESY